MMIRDPRGRRWARHASRTATLVAGAMLAVSAWATIDSNLDRAVAAPNLAGPAQVVQPSTGADPGKQLNSGAFADPFALKLPAGAECPGDSANDGWRVTSYVIAASADPAALTFNSDGPTANQYGEPQATHRQPLYDIYGSALVVAQTAVEDPEGSGGAIVNALEFNLSKGYDQTDPKFSMPAGAYDIGIACVNAAGASYPIDRYWNVEIEVKEAAGAWSWEARQLTATTIALDPSEPASPQAYGTAVKLTAKVTPDTAAGTVQFKAGTTPIEGTVAFTGGVATLTTSTLPKGTHQIAATFTPTDDKQFFPSTSTASEYVITGLPSKVTLAATPATGAKTGEEVTVTATIEATNGAGAVDFYNGTTKLGTATGAAGTAAGTWVATYKTSALPAGTHQLKAAFVPTDPGTEGSESAALAYTVAPGAQATTVTLTASPKDEAEEDEEVTFTATVTPATAVGTVTFKDGTKDMGKAVAVAGGKAELDVDDLKVGDHEIKATFTPTTATAFAASTSTALKYEITEAGGGDEAMATTLTIAVSPEGTAPLGSPVTITATISPAAPGSIVFKDGTTELGVQATDAEGKAVLTTSTLATGPHSFTASFIPGDSGAFKASSTVTPVTFQVGDAAAATGGATTGGAATGEPSSSSGGSGPTTSGSPLGQLPLTGGSLSLVLWSMALLVFGRIAILLARDAEVIEAQA